MKRGDVCVITVKGEVLNPGEILLIDWGLFDSIIQSNYTLTTSSSPDLGSSSVSALLRTFSLAGVGDGYHWAWCVWHCTKDKSSRSNEVNCVSSCLKVQSSILDKGCWYLNSVANQMSLDPTGPPEAQFIIGWNRAMAQVRPLCFLGSSSSATDDGLLTVRERSHQWCLLELHTVYFSGRHRSLCAVWTLS